MSGFVKVNMGGRIKSVSIQRSDVPAMKGALGRAILLDPCPRACNLGWDKATKTMVYCDQESAIRYKLQPRTYYIFLLGRLNTTLQGDVVGDDIIVEYLQVSDKVYEDFIVAYNEFPSVSTIALKKEATSPTYSYVKPLPSTYQIPEVYIKGIQDKLSRLDLNVLWALLENNVAKSPEQYEEILRNAITNPNLSEADKREIASRSAGAPQIEAPAYAVQSGNHQRVSAHRQAPVAPQLPGTQETATEDVEIIQDDTNFGGENEDFDDFKD